MLLLLTQACVHTSQGSTVKTPGAFVVHLEAGKGAEVALTVENTGEAPGTFCSYHTPFEGISNDIFIVELAGEEVGYRGKMAKRAPPGPQDHHTLKPGASHGPVRVDLTEAYGLKTGTYTVRYRGTSISGLPDSNPIELVIP